MPRNVNAMEYLDFAIEISEAKGDNCYKVSVKCPMGEPEALTTLSFDLQGLIDGLQGVSRTARSSQALMAVRDGDEDDVGQPAERSADAVGRQLYKAVFSGEIRTALNETIGSAKRQNAGVRIRLSFSNLGATMSRLASLPWEWMANEHGPLALSPRTPLVRSMKVMEPTDIPPVDGSIRILIIPSNPEGTAVLDLEAEKEQILREWANMNAVVEFERPVLSRLSERLQNEHWHVIHYMGHGQFRNGKGALLLEDDDGRRVAIDSARFMRELLPGAKYHPTLIFLNACNTAAMSASGAVDPFGGMAQGLIESGIPAVIAMQQPISDRAAIEFSKTFYNRIIANHPVDAAVAMARVRLNTEWATPVLYMRAETGELFEQNAPVISETRKAAHTTPLSTAVISPTPRPATPASGFTVFLSPSTETADPVVAEIRRVLSVLKVEVFTVDQNNPDDFEQRVKTLAQAANLTVHLMGTTPGKWLDERKVRSFPVEALRTAFLCARSQLILRPEGFEINTREYADYAEYMESIESASREKSRMEIIHTPSRKMAETVSEKVTDMMQERPSAATVGDVKSVFIELHSFDRMLKAKLRAHLQSKLIAVEFQTRAQDAPEPTQAQLQSEFEEQIRENPLWIVIDGNSPEGWAKERAKIAAKARIDAESTTTIGVLAIDPKEPPQLPIEFYRAVVTPPSFDPAALDELIDAASRA